MNKQPLADRIRPLSLEDMVGQPHLIGQNGILRRMLERGRISNMIFSGPPGTGKTTAAMIIAKASGMQLFKLNATTASLADVKEVASNTGNIFSSNGTILYLDEIQYFNKKQQQSLLEYMEDGRITLIASTTDNPYFCIYNAVLSRSSVFEFRPVTPLQCVPALRRALNILNEESGTPLTVTDEVLTSIARHGGGDVRCSVGLLENAYYISNGEITEDSIKELSPVLAGNFDRAGDAHYDLLSCLQKSIRGSDANAALFYLAKLLAGGDMLSVCRRLQVIASEDIGLAWPMGAVLTRACVESARDLGLPEASIPLSNAVVSLATAPKSNAAHIAYEAALADVNAGAGTDIPVHLRSPLFKGYKYPHDFENHFVEQQYLPDDLKTREYLQFGTSKTEQAAKAYYEALRKLHRQ